MVDTSAVEVVVRDDDDEEENDDGRDLRPVPGGDMAADLREKLIPMG